MASKVNVKFVAVLVAVLVGLLGVVGFVALQLVLKSGEDWARMGDRAMAEQDYERAKNCYERAVGNDQSNTEWMQKWIDALSLWTPETETEYQSAYGTSYLAVLRQISIEKKTDVQAHHDYLGHLWRQTQMTGYSRGTAESIAEQVTQALLRFPPDQSGPQDTLRRYRGMAFEAIMTARDTLSQENIDQAIADLQAALAADPTDSPAATTLARAFAHQAQASLEAGRTDEAAGLFDRGVRVVEDFLASNPGDARARLHRVMLSFDRDRTLRTGGMLPDEAMGVARELLADIAPDLQSIADGLAAMPPESVELPLLSRFQALESLASPEDRIARTRGILRALLAKAPQDASLLLALARMEEGAGDNEAAIQTLERVSALPDMPMSFEGLLLFSQRREAVSRRCSITLSQAAAVPADEANAPRRAELMAEARALRDQYALQVPEGDLQLTYLDGLLAQLNGDAQTALRQFRRYNEQTVNNDPRGLWAQGQSAAAVGENGLAESSFRQLLRIQPNNAGATLALAEVSARLQKPEVALALLEPLLKADPGNQALAERVTLLRAVVNPETAADPVTRALFEARKIRFGDAETTPDPAGAERMLADAMAANNNAPALARDLAMLRMDRGDAEGARAAVAASAAAHPEDPGIAQLNSAMAAGGSVTDTLVRLIDEADLPEVEKLISKISLYRSNDMPMEARSALDRAFTLAPEDPRVFELRFLDVLQSGDTAAIERMLGTASEKNLDRAGGLVYRARVAANAGDRRQAIESLRTAIAQGATDAGVFRLLASQQAGLSEMAEAISTLERGLELRPTSVELIVDHIALLAASGRVDDALAAARRNERVARADGRFTDLWLRLEANNGGTAGLELATRRREALASQSPQNQENMAELARLYIRAQRYADARGVIDTLRAQGDSLALAELDAAWHADQARVTIDGQSLPGVEGASSVFARYILSLPEAERTAEPYLAMARFMAGRNRGDIALRALQQAQQKQDPKTREADKLLADLALQNGDFETAYTNYLAVVDAGADEDTQIYRQRLIEAALRTARFDEAETQIARLTGPAAESLSTVLQRADAAEGKGDARRQREFLDEAVQRYPNASLAYMKRAQSMFGRPELLQDALSDLNSAVQLAPSDWRTLRMRGSLLYTQGRTDDALRDYRAALRANPGLDDVLLSLVSELTRQNRDRDAMTLAEEVFQARPTDAGVYLGVARVFGGLGRWDRAAQAAKAGWDRTQLPALGLTYLDALTRQPSPNLREADAVLTRLTQVAPDFAQRPSLGIARAQLALARGRATEAMDLLVGSFALVEPQLGPTLGWVSTVANIPSLESAGGVSAVVERVRTQDNQERNRWLDLGLGRSLAGQEDSRARGYELLGKVRAADDRDEAARLSFQAEGSARFSDADFQGARDVWAAGLAKFPDDRELNNNQAFLLTSRFNEAQAALPLAERAVSAGQPSAPIFDTLAGVYLALGRLDEAESTLRTAERLAGTAPQRIEVLIHRAELELKKSRPTAARSIYGEIQSLLPSAGEQRDALSPRVDTLRTQIEDSEG